MKNLNQTIQVKVLGLSDFLKLGKLLSEMYEVEKGKIKKLFDENGITYTQSPDKLGIQFPINDMDNASEEVRVTYLAHCRRIKRLTEEIISANSLEYSFEIT